MKFRWALVVIWLFVPLPAMAVFWQGHGEGWHWYQDPEELAAHEQVKSHQPAQVLSATEQMHQLTAEAEERLNRAVLSPTDQNVKDYLAIQYRLLENSSKFSERYHRTVWQHPEIDSSIDYPTSTVGHQVYDAIQKETMETTLASGKNEYGLFFYFESTCPYCRRMAPTIKEFAEVYGFDLKAITLDGISIPEFPDASVDNGSAARLQMQAAPALYLIHHETAQIIPVGFGMMDFNEIEKRLLVLISEHEEKHRG